MDFTKSQQSKDPGGTSAVAGLDLFANAENLLDEIAVRWQQEESGYFTRLRLAGYFTNWTCSTCDCSNGC